MLPFVQTLKSLTLTPGDRFAANSEGHLISYWLATASTETFIRCGTDSFLSFLEIEFFYFHTPFLVLLSRKTTELLDMDKIN